MIVSVLSYSSSQCYGMLLSQQINCTANFPHVQVFFASEKNLVKSSRRTRFRLQNLTDRLQKTVIFHENRPKNQPIFCLISTIKICYF